MITKKAPMVRAPRAFKVTSLGSTALYRLGGQSGLLSCGHAVLTAASIAASMEGPKTAITIDPEVVKAMSVLIVNVGTSVYWKVSFGMSVMVMEVVPQCTDTLKMAAKCG